MVSLVTPDDVSFMVAVGPDNRATYVNRDLGVQLFFRQIHGEPSRDQPRLGIWSQEEGTAEVDNAAPLEVVSVGSTFSLAEIPGLQGSTRWIIPGEWTEKRTAPLTHRMIRFRVRFLDGDWIKLTALEGELARVTDLGGRGLGLVPTIGATEDVQFHLYSVEASMGCSAERLDFLSVASAEPFVPVSIEIADQLFELEVLEAVSPLDQEPLPVDTSQCWSWHCGASGNQRAHAHACVVECGGNCCAADLCSC